MKITFSCVHFPVWQYPPPNNEKPVFYTGKLYGLTGMQYLLTDVLFHDRDVKTGMKMEFP